MDSKKSIALTADNLISEMKAALYNVQLCIETFEADLSKLTLNDCYAIFQRNVNRLNECMQYAMEKVK